MNKREKPKLHAAPAIGDRSLTLREAADAEAIGRDRGSRLPRLK